MAGDERNAAGTPPRAEGSTPHDVPDSQAIKSAPAPEAPEAPVALGEPAEAPASDGGDSGGEDAAEQPAQSGSESESRGDRLRREIAEARRTLEAKEAELVRVEARQREDEAATKMVADYSAEVPALTASENELTRYQAAATSFLGEILPAETRAAIEEAHRGPEQAIAELRGDIQRKEREAADAHAGLDEARREAAAAKDRADALKNPAASVRDRIKRAAAIRAEATKASDAGRYALAYWLVMPNGRLANAIAAEPAIIDPRDLRKEIKAAAAARKQADERVAALTAEVEAGEAGLRKDRTRLAELERGLDATVLAELARLNPQSAAVA